MAKVINPFYHQAIVDYFTKLSPSDGHTLSEEEKGLISKGFCYSLVMDWLNNSQGAVKHYWNPPLVSKPQALVNNRMEVTGEIEYYYGIIKKYCEYCKTIAPIFSRNTMLLSAKLKSGCPVKFHIVKPDVDFEQTQEYIKKNGYRMKFNRGGLKQNTEKDDLQTFFNTIEGVKPYFNMIFNICILDSGNKETTGNAMGHSIGIRKINQGNQTCYIIFDPGLGVVMVNDCGAALSKMITNRYSQRQDYWFACFYLMRSYWITIHIKIWNFMFSSFAFLFSLCYNSIIRRAFQNILYKR